MIVVAYNPTNLSQDEYLQGAAKARYGLAAHSVAKLAELIGAYADHSITTLMIADHGTAGIQGLGSGQTADYSLGKNLSYEHIKVSSQTVGPTPLSGVQGTGAEAMMAYLMKVAQDGFTSRNQADFIRKIAGKIKYGGNLFLTGCSVGSGEEGKKLIESLGLAVQNSIRVVANLYETSWTDTTKPVIYPARHSPYRKLIVGDVIGCMGMRALSDNELQSVLDNTNILATN